MGGSTCEHGEALLAEESHFPMQACWCCVDAGSAGAVERGGGMREESGKEARISDGKIHYR